MVSNHERFIHCDFQSIRETPKWLSGTLVSRPQDEQTDSRDKGKQSRVLAPATRVQRAIYKPPVYLRREIKSPGPGHKLGSESHLAHSTCRDLSRSGMSGEDLFARMMCGKHVPYPRQGGTALSQGSAPSNPRWRAVLRVKCQLLLPANGTPTAGEEKAGCARWTSADRTHSSQRWGCWKTGSQGATFLLQGKGRI